MKASIAQVEFLVTVQADGAPEVKVFAFDRRDGTLLALPDANVTVAWLDTGGDLDAASALYELLTEYGHPEAEAYRPVDYEGIVDYEPDDAPYY